jgi:hypothetical protein
MYDSRAAYEAARLNDHGVESGREDPVQLPSIVRVGGNAHHNLVLTARDPFHDRARFPIEFGPLRQAQTPFSADFVRIAHAAQVRRARLTQVGTSRHFTAFHHDCFWEF